MAIICKTDWTIDKSLEYADLNRIESNVAQMQASLQSIGFIIPLEDKKTNWNMTNWARISEINRLKRNINSLRAGFYVFPNTPILVVDNSTEQTHDWRIQNTMEKILDDLNKSYIAWLRTQSAIQTYAGNFYCGEEVIL